MATEVDIEADRRVWCDRLFTFLERDFTGASLKMQVRQFKDTTGTPLIDTNSTAGGVQITYAGTATVSAHIAAGRLDSSIYSVRNPTTGAYYVAGDSLTLSQVLVHLDPSTLAAMPFPDERGDDFIAWYDIQVTPSGGVASIELRGRFILHAGVTI